MINLLFLIGCLNHSKIKIKYTHIGVVDRVENGICSIEISDALFFKYSPTTIHIYSKTCKEGDIIAVGTMR